MDSYTEKTRAWLDKRFTLTDHRGVYHAHQPIYGFRNGPAEAGMTSRYIITYQIMRALAHLRFNTFLDVGGAEGYKAALVRSIFGAEVRSCDLSEEASLRAREIFNVDGEAVDINQLPYDDEQFDVVLCSETLEHVPDIERATRELLRVCSKALVITVPHESAAVVQRNIDQKIPHGHIHSLDLNSFNFTRPLATKILGRKMLSPLLKIPCVLVDGVERGQAEGYPGFLVKLYDSLAPLFRYVFGERSASLLISLDNVLSKMRGPYGGITFILLKDVSCYNDSRTERITPSQIINFRVPFHYLSGEKP